MQLLLTRLARSDAYAGQLEVDLGNLSAFDPAPLDAADFDAPEAASARCLELATAITQALVGQLFGLPAEPITGGRLAQLPEPVSRLPRGKPLPKPKPLT
jgi:regulator of ribosome biosynthesis